MIYVKIDNGGVPEWFRGCPRVTPAEAERVLSGARPGEFAATVGDPRARLGLYEVAPGGFFRARPDRAASARGMRAYMRDSSRGNGGTATEWLTT